MQASRIFDTFIDKLLTLNSAAILRYSKWQFSIKSLIFNRLLNLLTTNEKLEGFLYSS